MSLQGGIAYDARLVKDAYKAFCWDKDLTPPVDMVEFAAWCEANDPDASVELEKFAANVFNRRLATQ